MGLMPARPAAISICAPQGIMPCAKHDIVSRMEAVRRGAMWKRWAIWRATGPTARIAIVLLAVSMSTAITADEMLASAARGPRMCRHRVLTVFSIIPRLVSQYMMTAAQIVKMIRSCMLCVPSHMAFQMPANVSVPCASAITEAHRIPASSTRMTWIPHRARMNMVAYGSMCKALMPFTLDVWWMLLPRMQ